MGNTCKPMAVSFQCMTKSTTIKKKILKEINPEFSLEGLMLKLQSFSHLMQRADSLGKTLMLGKIEGKRRAEDEIAGQHQ